MPCGASLTVPVPLLPRKVAAGVAAPGAIGGPPGEPAGAVAKRWSALDQMPMKLTSTSTVDVDDHGTRRRDGNRAGHWDGLQVVVVVGTSGWKLCGRQRRLTLAERWWWYFRSLRIGGANQYCDPQRGDASQHHIAHSTLVSMPIGAPPLKTPALFVNLCQQTCGYEEYASLARRLR